MNSRNQINQYITAVAVLGSLTFAATAWAEANSNELIVRFRDPQNTKIQATESFNATSGMEEGEAQVLNSSEGVVRLRFTTPEAAATARARLEFSNQILNVAENHLYQLAVKYRFREVEKKSAPLSFLDLPFPSKDGTDAGTNPSIPDVQLPGSQQQGDDALGGQDWAVDKVHLPSYSELAASIPTSSQMVTAVIDTGVDYNHEDLIAGMWRNPDNAHEVGYDFAHDNAKPYDVRQFDLQGCLKDPDCSSGADSSKFLVNPGHGTHCAGHVGAVANNAIGIRGVGFQNQIMALKFFHDAGEPNAGQGDDAGGIKSIDYAIDHGAKVISASWGGRMKRDDAEKSELKAVLVRAQKAGVIVVVAAGNDSINQDAVDEPDYPAAFDLDNLIVVAATDKDDGIADFSNYGQKSVHIAAPGVKIFSTTVQSQYNDVVSTFTDNQGKQREMDWDGTSMATPIVAGAVALVWAQNPTEDYHSIRKRILDSARPVDGLQGKVITGGVLDVARALHP